MTPEDLQFFKCWFADFCASYSMPDESDQMNIRLKEVHTVRVCENILALARDLSEGAEQCLLAEAIALFHDVGRFPQYARFRTFQDSLSVNHGLLGAEILAEQNVLGRLDADERRIVAEAVKFHNAFSLPKKSDADTLFFIKLIRDADKLDIWRVFIEYYESPKESRASAVGLGLPDLPGYSAPVVDTIINGEIVPLSLVKTLDDLKLMQLSWIYDLNYRPSFKMLLERDYIGRITARLPRTDDIGGISSRLEAFSRERSSGTVGIPR